MEYLGFPSFPSFQSSSSTIFLSPPSSFRLFDERKDVLILVFLEEIPTYEMSPHHRMRKLLKRQTYLSWPQVGEHTEVFWEKLRKALRAEEEGLNEDRLLLTVMD